MSLVKLEVVFPAGKSDPQRLLTKQVLPFPQGPMMMAFTDGWSYFLGGFFNGNLNFRIEVAVVVEFCLS